MSASRCTPALLVAALSLPCVACDDPPQPVTLRFAAQVDGVDLACDRSYPGVGTSAATVELVDARMYLHAPQLITAGGGLVPLMLEVDRSQDPEVGLLDFRDGGGRCSSDDLVPHTALTGWAPQGDYRGVRFELGLPRALDDRLAHAAVPPFDRPGLWRGDEPHRYYYAQLAVATSTGAGYGLWLGAAGCDRGADSCAADNVATVVLFGDLERDVVVLDLGRLWAEVDLTPPHDPADPSPGCRVEAGDPDCPPVLAQLGLDPSGSPTGAHDAFTMQRR